MVIIQQCAVLFIVLCGFSIMLSPTKWDPFLLTRPIGRYARRIFARLVVGSYKTLKRWMKAMWGITKNARKSSVARVCAAVSLPMLAAGVVLLLIPADILGGGKK